MPGENISRMEIKVHLPHDAIFAFLQRRGYETKPWLYIYEEETFPNGKSQHESWTFTATKSGELQSKEALFLTVFEREIQLFFKEFK